MNFLRKLEVIILNLFSKSLMNNEKFKNKHEGETCFIVGNGGSLKYFDLSVLKNSVTIGCTYSLIDNRLKGFGLNYCVFPSAYLMYPFWKKKNPKTGQRIQLNALAPIFKKIIKENDKTQFFLSLTNKFTFLKQPKNVNYIYHYGNKNNDSYDMTGSFSTATGALDFMLGISKYLGFSNVVILGCDYLGQPCMENHFYSSDKPYIGNNKVDYTNRIRKLVDFLELDVLTIFPEGVSSSAFESKSFAEYFKVDEKYHNQSQIIDDGYMELIKIACSKNQISLFNND
jgi:hypothetical protein